MVRGDIPLLVLGWRVVPLWAVRGIVPPQGAHLHEHTNASNKGRGASTELYHTTAPLQPMRLGQVSNTSCNWQVAGV